MDNSFLRTKKSRRTTGRQEIYNDGDIATRSRRETLPVAVDALRKLLKDFNARSGARISAIVSRSGVPVAWALPDDVQVDNFATMAATLLGALEVIYSSMRSGAPGAVTVEADRGVLMVRDLTGKMFFVAMAEKRTIPFAKAVNETLGEVLGLLGES